MTAVGSIMRGVASRLGEDQDLWQVVGLVHDVDFEETDMKQHGLKASQMLKDLLPREALDAIASHNYENTGVMPTSTMSKALIASDAVSGLIVAAALVMPDKKLSRVTASGLLRKFKDKDFARGADRDKMRYCEQIGIPLQEFLGIALRSAQEVAVELGFGGD